MAVCLVIAAFFLEAKVPYWYKTVTRTQENYPIRQAQIPFLIQNLPETGKMNHLPMVYRS